MENPAPKQHANQVTGFSMMAFAKGVQPLRGHKLSTHAMQMLAYVTRLCVKMEHVSHVQPSGSLISFYEPA